MILYLDTTAADKTAAAITSTTDFTALATLQTLTLGDSEALTLHFMASSGVYATWATDATYSISVGLGNVSTDATRLYSATTSFSIVGSTRTGRLALDTFQLRGAIYDAITGYSHRTGGFLWLHIRYTDPNGYYVTVAMLRIWVEARVLSDDSLIDASFSHVANSLLGYDGNNSLHNVTVGSGLTLAGNVLTAAGGSGTVTSVAFTGGIISVATPTTTPAFTVAGTSGGIPYFSSATTWATSAALAASALVLGGGAGAAPATTTTGTGVVTALGVNVGSAGAFLVNGGALGTPSSGTLTNCTGLPITGITSSTSAQLRTLLSDENGTGVALFDAAASPSFTTSVTTASATFALFNATATTINFAGACTTLNIGASATCILNFGGGTTASEFRFLEPSGSGTNYTAFKAVAQSANITYSLPPTAGAAGTVLTDAAGNGVLTWVAAGAGTVTVVGAGALTSTALVTGGGTTTLQTPSATATLDASGNISTPGSVTSGAGGSTAGALELGQGTAPSTGMTSIKLYAPASVTSYLIALPSAVGSTGLMAWTVSGTTATLSSTTTPALGTPASGVATNLTGTAKSVTTVSNPIVFQQQFSVL